MSVVGTHQTPEKDVPQPPKDADWSHVSVLVEQLKFGYNASGEPALNDVTLSLPRGARCLLVGANGAGKSTLLRVLAGKRLQRERVFVLGHNAFFDSPAGVAYLGTEWAMNPVVHRDVPVRRLLASMGADRWPERACELVHLLDVNPNWHMHQVSDGQRRRVQIVMGLLEPWDLLLLDEVTVDLDVVVRGNLLNYLRLETETRGATILYATHIFDGLGPWPTHVAHLRAGGLAHLRTWPGGFPELSAAAEQQSRENEAMFSSPLLRVVEDWLCVDLQLHREECELAQVPVHGEAAALVRGGQSQQSFVARGPKAQWEQLLEQRQYVRRP